MKKIVINKKALIISICVAVLVALAVVAVVLIQGRDKNKYTEGLLFAECDGGYAVTGCKTNETVINIPPKYNGEPVIEISGNAFKETGIQAITIPDTVKSISANAFANCTALQTLVIPDSVTTIGISAFSGCTALYKVTLGKGVNFVGRNAFSGCTRIIEVYNRSAMKITAGGTECSEVAKYAKNVYTDESGSSKLEPVDGLIFYTGDAIPTVFAYEGNSSTLTLPDSFKGGNYTISSYAFKGRSDLQTLNLGRGVTSIESRAFAGCRFLNKLVIPEGSKLTNVGAGAFREDELVEVYAPSLESWLAISFSDEEANPVYKSRKLYIDGEAIVDLVIPESVTEIPMLSFYGIESIKTVTFHKNIKKIGALAFRNCSNIERVNVEDIGAWCGVKLVDNTNPLMYGKLYVAGELVTDLVIPEGTTHLLSDTFYYCKQLRSVTLPSTLTWYMDAFTGCDALTIVYNNSSRGLTTSLQESVIAHIRPGDENKLVTAENGCRFYNTGSGYTLIDYKGEGGDVILPPSPDGSAYSIAKYAFVNESTVTGVTIHDSVTSMGIYAFSNCTALERVSIGKGLTTSGGAAFSGSINIKSIYYNARNLADLSQYSALYSRATDHAGISVVIGNSVERIPNRAFIGAKVSKLEFEEGSTCRAIGERAFAMQYFSTLVIPDSVTTIGYRAFSTCSSLVHLTLGKSVNSIDTEAFELCYSLKEIYNRSSLSLKKDSTAHGNVAENVFYIFTVSPENTNIEKSNGFYFYKHGSQLFLVGYEESEVGVKDITLPEPLFRYSEYYLESYSFSRKGAVTVTVPSCVKAINKYAFSGCEFLKSVTVSEGVKHINEHAFEQCEVLETITLPSTLTWLGNSAFYGCLKLTEIYIPEGITKIGYATFYNCKELKKVYIPASVTEIAEHAFKECQAIESFTFGGSREQFAAITIDKESRARLTAKGVNYES